jgi:nicotinamide phosphoribosyltransferase
MDGDKDYLVSMVRRNGRKGNIVSIVADGYNIYDAVRTMCTPEFVAMVRSIGCRLVVRPDSGDMYEIVPWILDQLADAYGAEVNESGYKVINGAGVLQGDGISLESMTKLLDVIVSRGYRADSVVFGSGGALLQKVNRDTYKYAQKASAVLVKDGDEYKWVGIVKDPVTDPGKKSKMGVLSLFKSKMTGQYATFRIDQGDLDSEWEDVMEDLYDCGEFFNRTTVLEARARAMS